jgi:uncharacterized membrane protein
MPARPFDLTALSVFSVFIGLALWCQMPSAVPAPAADGRSWNLEQPYQGWIDVVGRQVPLPGGAWVLVGIGLDPTNLEPIRAYGVIFTLVLFKLNGSAVEAFALIHANAVPTDSGWGLSRDCQRTDLPFAKVYDSGEYSAFCTFVRSIRTPLGPTDVGLAAWQRAGDLASRHGWQLPSTWIEAGFRIGDRHDVLDVRYAFSPETIGAAPDLSNHSATATGQTTDESTNNLFMIAIARTVAAVSSFWSGTEPSQPAPADPHQTLTANLIPWTSEMRHLIRFGFKHRLAGLPVLDMPGVHLPSPGLLTQIRLQHLEASGAADALGADQYASLRQQLAESDEVPAAQEISNTKLGLWKVLSSRVVNITTSLGIDYLFVGDIGLASRLQLVSSTSHGGVDYVEELLWNTYGPQRLRQASTCDFTYVGITDY